MIKKLTSAGSFVFIFLILSQAAAAQSDYTKLYWSDYEANSIERINFDGSDRETVVANTGAAGSGPISIEVDVPHQKIYWLDNNTSQIKRANFDGTGAEIFISNPGYAGTLYIDPSGGKLYWPDYEANSIESINLDGTGRTTVISDAADAGGGPASMIIDKVHGKAYWLDNGSNQIKRANLDGTDKEVFISDPGYTYQMTLNAASSQLYWSDYDANSIERINVDGTDRETVVADAADPGSGPFSLALDETDNKVFWLDNFSANIKSANLDGTDKQVFISNPGFANNLMIPKQSTPLPIDLLSFTANNKDCTPSIEWTTANAISFSNFELQRSKDGSSFDAIAKIPYIGNKNSYQYQDKGTGNGNLFYRLKMVDIDGHAKYSSIISAHVDCGAPATFSVFPNPIKGEAYLSTDKMVRQIDVISVTGKIVWSCIPAQQTGNIPLAFGQAISKGVYILKGTLTDGSVRQVTVLKQ